MGKKIELVRAGGIKKVRADALGVSRKNIYRVSKQMSKDEALRQEINKVHIKHPAYGHKRLALELKVNKKRILRVMKIFGIKPPRRKSYYYTTRSTKEPHKYTNLIKDLIIAKSNQLWCSDLSYIKFQGKFWYLATIEDIFTRQVLAAQMGKYHNSELVMETIRQAIRGTGKAPEIFHCDQGTEFMAKVCTDYLEGLTTNISVSDKASPWQNGYQESFFGKFKDEIGDLNRFETVGELIEEIYSQIHYYNYDRIHTKLKMPPAVYAQLVKE
ncbi:IS3 family transposase [Patescibacteria group bacterium]|nr:IS3 family transposase [Patescibacteria group bacterium]